MSGQPGWEWVLEVDVKGGPGSGNFGHAGRPGQVGGSASGSGSGDTNAAQIDADEVAFNAMSGLLKYSTNDHRRLLAAKVRDEIPKAIVAAGIEAKDVEGVYLFGSYSSDKPTPHDVDLAIQVRSDIPEHPAKLGAPASESLPNGESFDYGGRYDITSWAQGEHDVGIIFITFERNMKDFLGQVEFEAPQGEFQYKKPERIWP